MTAKPKAFHDWPDSLPIEYGPFRAVTDRVHDGDSVLCFFDLACDTYVPIWVRVAGIDSPESWQPGGDEATAFLESLMPRDTPCLIRPLDWSFGRIVGAITLADGRDVATEIVSVGHGEWREY